MLRVVFDTVVFVRALINPYSHCGRLVFEHFGQYRLFVSREILQEILGVLRWPELAGKFRAVAGLDIGRVLQIVSAAEAIEAAPVERGSRDPNDDKFLGAAAAVRADYLVSEDQDLKILNEYASARIISCEDFLAILEQPET